MRDGRRSAAEWSMVMKTAEVEEEARKTWEAAKARAAEALAAWMTAIEAEAREWLETPEGREWASADDVASNDAGPSDADLRGEVHHGG